jgi:hypothetical protein
MEMVMMMRVVMMVSYGWKCGLDALGQSPYGGSDGVGDEHLWMKNDGGEKREEALDLLAHGIPISSLHVCTIIFLYIYSWHCSLGSISTWKK